MGKTNAFDKLFMLHDEDVGKVLWKYRITWKEEEAEE
jgi:hypothetical protein